MVGKLTIGVLALQGAFAKHSEMLTQMSVRNLEVYTVDHLESCDGLIIPGGESTAIFNQINHFHMQKPLLRFAKTRPIFGTCAGMILMERLGLLNLKIERNGFGRQLHSFMAPLRFKEATIEGIFIRAPRIINISSPNIETLISYAGESVCVRQNIHLATTFHPELTNDSTIHQYFVQLCEGVNG